MPLPLHRWFPAAKAPGTIDLYALSQAVVKAPKRAIRVSRMLSRSVALPRFRSKRGVAEPRGSRRVAAGWL